MERVASRLLQVSALSILGRDARIPRNPCLGHPHPGSLIRGAFRAMAGVSLWRVYVSWRVLDCVRIFAQHLRHRTGHVVGSTPAVPDCHAFRLNIAPSSTYWMLCCPRETPRVTALFSSSILRSQQHVGSLYLELRAGRSTLSRHVILLHFWEDYHRPQNRYMPEKTVWGNGIWAYVIEGAPKKCVWGFNWGIGP